MSPIAWWNDDLVELSDDVSLEECLRQSRSAGFTGMEMGRRFPERSRRSCCRSSRAADVTLCGGWFSGTLVNEDMAANKDRIQPMIELFKAVNAPCIVYGEVGRSIQGDRSQAARDQAEAFGRRDEGLCQEGSPSSANGAPSRACRCPITTTWRRWSRPSRNSMPSCAIRAPAFRCCSMPGIWPLPAATCCAPSTITTSASPTCM